MANSGSVEELRLLIKSRHPILYVESHEEERLEQLLGAVSNELERTFGFSGAEIEQVVVTSLYGVLAENAAQLTTEHLVAEVGNTVPLSRSRREYVNNLREMARERFVPAR